MRLRGSGVADRRNRRSIARRPEFAASRCHHRRRLAEVVRVGLELEGAGRRRVDAGGDAMLGGIGLGRVLVGEGQADLRLRITAAGPAHQRIGALGLGRGELELQCGISDTRAWTRRLLFFFRRKCPPKRLQTGMCDCLVSSE